MAQTGKVSARNAGDPGLIPRSERSPGEGNGNLLKYSCLKNSMDGGAWWATVHEVAKSRTRPGDFSLPHSLPHLDENCMKVRMVLEFSLLCPQGSEVPDTGCALNNHQFHEYLDG